MSLQIWLPLTKDLKNWGLGSDVVVNNGATYSATGGKFGGCYDFNASNNNYMYFNKNTYNLESSYSLWFYPTTPSSFQYLMCCGSSDEWKGLHVGYDDTTLDADLGSGSMYVLRKYSDYPIFNAWNHLVVTTHYNTKSDRPELDTYLYINGLLDKSASTSNFDKEDDWGNVFSIGAYQANGTDYRNYFDGKICDVRYYDHCLSKKEVKELSQGLMVHYLLNGNITGTTEYDTSGFCNNATVNGTLTYSTDTPKYEKSAIFDGSTCLSCDLPYLGNEWSYACWFYSPTSSNVGENVITLNTSGGDSDYQFAFLTNPYSGRAQSSANGEFINSIPFTCDRWNHIVASFDGSQLKAYINGALIDTKTISAPHLERHKLTIGARNSGSGFSNYFTGKINDVRVYATALDATDVKSLYQNMAYIDSVGNIYGKIRE